MSLPPLRGRPIEGPHWTPLKYRRAPGALLPDSTVSHKPYSFQLIIIVQFWKWNSPMLYSTDHIFPYSGVTQPSSIENIRLDEVKLQTKFVGPGEVWLGPNFDKPCMQRFNKKCTTTLKSDQKFQRIWLFWISQKKSQKFHSWHQ